MRQTHDAAAEVRGPAARFVAAAVLVAAIVFVAALFVALVLMLETCGGDGGSPYAAPASPRGRYCDSGLPWISLVAGIVLTAIGGTVSVRHRRWRPLAACATLGTVLVVSPAAIGSALSKECADKPVSMTADEFRRYLHEHPDCAHY